MARKNDCSVSPSVCPANIYATTREGKEGDNVSLTCSIVGIQASKNGIIYLSKDGIGIRMRTLADSEEFIFILFDVKQNDSGNYSCVYSKTKVKVSQIKATGITSVFIQIHSQPKLGIHNSTNPFRHLCKVLLPCLR